MKALTLHQPHAGLVAVGLKHYETRSWRTRHRGELLIHAGKSVDKIIDARLGKDRIWIGCPEARIYTEARGMLLCIVELVDCVPADTVRGRRNLEFGDFSAGRWAWLLRVVARFSPGIVHRGYQGLWNVDPAVESFIRESL